MGRRWCSGIMQLVTGKSITLPGISNGNLATESLYDDEAVRQIMSRHHEIMKDFRESEFSKKLQRAQNARSKGYEDRILKEGDLVFHQHQGRKSWLGLVEVFAVKDNNIFIFTNGSIRKVPRCNVQYLRSREEDPPSSNDLKTLNSCGPGSQPGMKKVPIMENLGGCGDSSKAEVAVDAEERRVEFEEEDFGEGIDEKDIEEIGRRRTRR